MKLCYFLYFSIPRDYLRTRSQSHRLLCTFKIFLEPAMFLPFSCTHLALWRDKGKVKGPRYMQNKKDSRISLHCTSLNQKNKNNPIVKNFLKPAMFCHLAVLI